MFQMMAKLFACVFLLALCLCARSAMAEPIHLTTDFGDFILPFQVVNGTQLYSFKEGKGFPGVETVLWGKGRYEFTFGAAPVLGTDVNVPFICLQHCLNPKIFDTSNNDLQFGVWVGRPSRRLNDEKPRTLWGIKASIPLW